MYYDGPELAAMLDAVVLRPEYTRGQVEEICNEAAQHGFALVSALSQWLPLVRDCLRGTRVAPGVAVGFPLGASTAAKVAETRQAIADGAQEVDVVAQVGALRSGEYDYYRRDLATMVAVARDRALVKVIVETCFLSEEEKKQACLLVMEAGADFIKTSTGFGPAGAAVADVRLFAELGRGHLQVKAAGGIKTLDQVKDFIRAGASRLGTSSGAKILADLNRQGGLEV